MVGRIEVLDARVVSRALEGRTLVRVLSLRDTVHLHVRDDALSLPG